MSEATLAFNILTKYKDAGAKAAATGLGKVGRSASEMGDLARKGAAKATAGLDDMKKGAAEVGQSLGKVASDAKESFSKVGVLAGGALGIGMASSFGAALSSLDASAKLKAQLGLTEKQSSRAGKVAGSLYSHAYGESLGEVNDAVRLVVQDTNTSLGSVRLEGITGKVMSLAQTFDQDLGGVTRAVGQLMRTGLAKNASQALDIVASGFQNGADKSDDFLDTLNEYGTQFRKLGLSGQVATGLISQGLKAGARDGDVVADALKEFSIRAVDGSDASQVAFEKLGLSASKMTAQIAKGGKPAAAGLQTVLDKLRGIHDPVKREAAAVGLFGTQAEDLGAALFALDTKKAVGELGKVGGAAKGVDKTVGATAGATLTAFKRSVETNVVNGLASAIKSFQTGKTEGDGFVGVMSRIGATARDAGAFVMEHQTAVKALVVVVGTGIAISKTYAAGVTTVKTVSKAVAVATKVWAAGQWLLNAAMTANPIGLVVVAIAALAAGVVIAYKKSETFRNIVQGAWKVIGTAARLYWNAYLKPVFTLLKAGFEKAQAAGKAMRDGLGRAWEGIKNAAKSGTMWVVDKVLWMAEKVLDGAVAAFGWAPGIGDKLKAARDKVTQFREDVNRELDQVKDEKVNITVAAGTAVASLQSLFGGKGKGMALGGPVTGGIPGKDSVDARLMPGEHVLTTDEVRKAGGHKAIMAIRRMLKRGEFGKNGDVPAFANGGPVYGMSTPGMGFLDPIQPAVTGAAGRLAEVLEEKVQAMLKRLGGQGSLSPSQIARGQAFAKSQVGDPYVWGGVGPNGFDCSGFVGAVLNAAQGRSPYSRRGTTGSMPWGGFSPGKGSFSVGWFTGSPGHMAGSIGGMGIESAGGAGVRIGGAATPVDSFPNVAHFEKGTDYVPRTGLAVLHKGEAVTPARGGEVIHVHVHLDGREIHQSLKKVRRDTRRPLGLE